MNMIYKGPCASNTPVKHLVPSGCWGRERTQKADQDPAGWFNPATGSISSGATKTRWHFFTNPDPSKPAEAGRKRYHEAPSQWAESRAARALGAAE